MDKKTAHQPDYKFWSKFDKWSFKDAALLLHGLDPLKFKLVRFNMRELPESPELEEPYKTFLILKDANSQQQRPFSDNSVSPNFIMTIAIQKELPVPKELPKLFEERYKKEQKNKKAEEKVVTNQQKKMNTSIGNDKELSTRERRSLLKAIGIMAFLLTDDPRRSAQFKLNDRANAYQIAQAVLDKAQCLSIEPEGIKSLNRKIKEALELLMEEELKA